MNIEFMNKTKDYLKKSKLNLVFPETRYFKFEENKIPIFMDLTDELFICKSNLSENEIISNILVFSLLDSYIDAKYPNIIGLSFKKKYDKIQSKDDREVILKEIFRVMKLIRNSIVHNLGEIKENTKESIYKYNFNNTEFYLCIDKEALRIIYSIIFILIEYPNDEYSIGILRKYYDELKEFIDKNSNLKDDITINHKELLTISKGIRLQRIVRYTINDAQYIERNTYIYIEEHKEVKQGMDKYGIDYIINYKKLKYRIPEEALQESKITIKNLEKWKII